MKKLLAVAIERRASSRLFFITLKYSVLGVTYTKIYKRKFNGSEQAVIRYESQALIPFVEEILDNEMPGSSFPSFFSSEH